MNEELVDQSERNSFSGKNQISFEKLSQEIYLREKEREKNLELNLGQQGQVLQNSGIIPHLPVNPIRNINLPLRKKRTYGSSKGYLSFEEARKFAASLNLKTRREWRSYVKNEFPELPKKPENIPSHPDGIYKVKGWQGWKFWLGTTENDLF